MSGGGGGNRYMMMYLMQQQQQQQAQQERMWQEQKEQATLASQKQEAEQARQRELSSGRVASSYDSAIAEAQRRLAAKGLDTSSGYGQQIYDLVLGNYGTARSSAPEIVSDASGLFRPTAVDDFYNEILNNTRSQYTNQFNQIAGSNFQNSLIGDTADDAFLDSIIGNQYTNAADTLKRALDRGQINDAGYSRSMSDLDLARSGAQSIATGMGDSVLQSYRDQLLDMASGYRGDINNYNLQGDLDVAGWGNNLQTKATDLLGRLQGDITNKIGDYSFFDTESLLGKAGVNSGVMNNNTQMRPTSGIGTTSTMTNQPGTIGLYEEDKDRQNSVAGAF